MAGFSFKDTNQFLPLRLGPTAHDTLQEFIDIDVTTDDLVRILQRNQAYKDLVSRFVNQKTAKPAAKTQKPEEKDQAPAAPESPTHRLINLLGMIGSRNLIVALRMHKAINGSFPVAEDGTVEIKAVEYLKRALEAEEIFTRLKLEYSETAYAAAVYFDWMTQLLATKENFRRLEGYAEHVWKRALRTGLISYFLAQEVKGVSPKHALAAGILLHGGKLFLASADDDYPDWETQLDANEAVTPLARVLAERERWGVSHELVSAHSLRYFNVFSALITAVKVYREPYCLKGETEYPLSSLLYLADAMARSWKIPVDEKDPLIQGWAHPSLKHLRLTSTKLVEVMKKSMTAK